MKERMSNISERSSFCSSPSFVSIGSGITLTATSLATESGGSGGFRLENHALRWAAGRLLRLLGGLGGLGGLGCALG